MHLGQSFDGVPARGHLGTFQGILTIREKFHGLFFGDLIQSHDVFGSPGYRGIACVVDMVIALIIDEGHGLREGADIKHGQILADDKRHGTVSLWVGRCWTWLAGSLPSGSAGFSFSSRKTGSLSLMRS